MTLSRTNQQRALVALVEVLGLSVWFSATAVVPTLRSEWGIDATWLAYDIYAHPLGALHVGAEPGV